MLPPNKYDEWKVFDILFTPQNFLGRAKRAAPSAPASPPIGAATPPAAPSIVPTAVPSNYRQLIASKLAASVDLKRLVKAEISLPGEGWMGLINGGNRPMACVTLTIEAPLMPQTQTTGYTFKNGQIDDVFSIDAYPGGAVRAVIASALTCDKFTYVPFPELRRSRR